MTKLNRLYSPPTEPLADPQTLAHSAALVMAERERILATLAIQSASDPLNGRPQLSPSDELILGVTDPDFVSSPALLQHELDQRKQVLELRHELAFRDEESGWDLSDVEAAEHDLEIFRRQEIDSYLSSGAAHVLCCDESGYQLRTRERRIQAEAELVTARKQHEELLSSVPQLVRDRVARRLRRLEDSEAGRAVAEAESRVKAAEDVIVRYDITFDRGCRSTLPSWSDGRIKAEWLPYLIANCPTAIRNEPDGGQSIDGAVADKHISYLKETGINQLRSDLDSRRRDFNHEVAAAERVLRSWAGFGVVDLAALQELLDEEDAIERKERVDLLMQPVSTGF